LWRCSFPLSPIGSHQLPESVGTVDGWAKYFEKIIITLLSLDDEDAAVISPGAKKPEIGPHHAKTRKFTENQYKKAISKFHES
jgi:hypothetical protein